MSQRGSFFQPNGDWHRVAGVRDAVKAAQESYRSGVGLFHLLETVSRWRRVPPPQTLGATLQFYAKKVIQNIITSFGARLLACPRGGG
jgi:hypothetical protein